MTKAIMHYWVPPALRTACKHRPETLRTTGNWGDVECRNCLRHRPAEEQSVLTDTKRFTIDAESLERARAALDPANCHHNFQARHFPGHAISWLRLCTFCKIPDLDDLDLKIRGYAAEQATKLLVPGDRQGVRQSRSLKRRLRKARQIQDRRIARLQAQDKEPDYGGPDGAADPGVL